jgi:hypothetical protein
MMIMPLIKGNRVVVSIDRRVFVGLPYCLVLWSCSPPETLVAEADYSTRVVGKWLGTVGGERETISFGTDGTFVSQVRARGFISNTLGQGTTGTIRGSWSIKGKVITLNISGADDARLLNTSTASTIESSKSNELVVKSERGDISTFMRA